MATYSVLNADGTKVYFEATGAGTVGDPFVPRSADSAAILSALQSVLSVDGSGYTQPVSVSSLPLPTGASTAANQSTGNTALAAIQVAVELLDNIVDGTEAQVDIVASLPAGTDSIGTVGLDAGEEVVGKVGAPDDVVTLTATLDTSAYASGDVLFDTQEIVDAARADGEVVILQSITITDQDDQGMDMDLIFLDAATSIGTENAAVSITAADLADDALGSVSISEDDYVDMVAAKMATVAGIGLEMKADAADSSIYVAAVTRDAPTHTASGLVLKFAFLRS